MAQEAAPSISLWNTTTAHILKGLGAPCGAARLLCSEQAERSKDCPDPRQHCPHPRNWMSSKYVLAMFRHCGHVSNPLSASWRHLWVGHAAGVTATPNPDATTLSPRITHCALQPLVAQTVDHMERAHHQCAVQEPLYRLDPLSASPPGASAVPPQQHCGSQFLSATQILRQRPTGSQG